MTFSSTSSSITGTNPALYPAFQQYFREKQPPFLAAWGKNDLPKAEVLILDAGHFALETHADEIGKIMLNFLGKHVG